MEPKIIVVDPSDFSRRSTLGLLEELNLTVVGDAKAPQRALDLINNVLCNMCIIDMNLLEMTGIELTEKIRERSDHIGIIITSDLILEGLKIDSILAGASDILERPFDKGSLEKSIYYIQKILEVRE